MHFQKNDGVDTKTWIWAGAGLLNTLGVTWWCLWYFSWCSPWHSMQTLYLWIWKTKRGRTVQLNGEMVRKTFFNIFFLQNPGRKICLMARSHCTGPKPWVGLETELGTMGYFILYRTVHSAKGPGMGPDPLSPIVPVPFLVPVPVPFPCNVNVPLCCVLGFI